jgi:hypothetical protein
MFCLTMVLMISCSAGVMQEQPGTSLPHLAQRGMVKQFIVDDKPFLMLAGELHNSSSSNLDYMREALPGELARAGLNTVLAVVSWDLFEPEEGRYDFTLLDGLIRECRQQEMRLVILWFGSWKNGLSHYVPDWVKVDQKRFPRIRINNGKPIEALSPVSHKLLEADTRAYKAMLSRVKEIDEKEKTVIMIQIQNEVGILGDSRDRSPEADELFGAKIPVELINYLRDNREDLLPELLEVVKRDGMDTGGTWTEVFGPGMASEEIFMSWQYASFINTMAEEGKKIYNLPVFANAWIVQPEDNKPGDYPGGGPQAHVHDIWRAAGPSIDLLAPDIYLPNFAEICALYSRNGNVLFIPESRAGETGAANAFYAFGQANAIGYSPFGIDSRNIDQSDGPIARAYRILDQLSGHILQAQTTGDIAGVWLGADSSPEEHFLGGYRVIIDRKRTRRGTFAPELGYGLVISRGDGEFLVAGKDIQVHFYPDVDNPPMAGLLSVYEGNYVDGEWSPGRKLSGDNIMLNYRIDEEAAAGRTGSVVRTQSDRPEILRVKLYQFD